MSFTTLPSIEGFANNALTTISSPVAPSDVTVSVASIAGFPTDGQFRLLVDSELMLATGYDAGANQWQVTRGIEGTTAASHSVSAEVACILTRGAILKLKSESSFEQTYAFFQGSGATVPPYYDTGAALIAGLAANVVNTVPAKILLMGIYVGDNMSFPGAGTWDFPEFAPTTFEGGYDASFGAFPTVTFNAPTTFAAGVGSLFWKRLSASFGNTAFAVYQPSESGQPGGFWSLEDATLTNTGTQPVVNVSAAVGHPTIVELTGTSSLSASGSAPFFQISVDSATFHVYDGSTLGAGAFTVGGSATVTIHATPGAVIDPSFIGMAGVTIVRLGSSSSNGTFTFQPGGTAGGTTFTDLTALLTASAGLSSVTILCDGSFVANSVLVPFGDYNLPTSCTFVALPPPNSILTLTFQPFCRLHAFTAIEFDGFNLVIGNGNPAVTSFAAKQITFRDTSVTVAGGILMQAQGGLNPLIELYGSSSLQGPGLFCNINQFNSHAVVNLYDQSSVGAGLFTVTNPPGSVTFNVGVSASLDPSYVGVGSITINNVSQYVPAVPANWSGTTTMTLKEALDRLAAHVGPIP